MINLNDGARCYVSTEFTVSFLSKIECGVNNRSGCQGVFFKALDEFTDASRAFENSS